MGTVVGRGAKKPKNEVAALKKEIQKLEKENKELKAELEVLREAQGQPKPEGQQ